MPWILEAAIFASIGAPSAALILDRIRDFPATRFFKSLGTLALTVFLSITIYAYLAGLPMLQLIMWGLVGGLLATVALDIVRLIGVRLGQFPMDMPRMFGAMALGVAPLLPKHIMGQMVAYMSNLAPDQRKEMLRPRILAISELPNDERLGFLSMMYIGLTRLTPERRQEFLATQIAVLSELPSDKRQAMLTTMDQVMRGEPAKVSSMNPFSPAAAFRRGVMPKIPMKTFGRLVNPALAEAAAEKKISVRQIIATGYLWHFVNGATYGIAYTFLFGRGAWPLAFAWGIFVWLVMMVGMPKMMPMIKLPYPKFMIVPLIAHIAMALPIGYFALTFINPQLASLLTVLLQKL